MFWSSFPLAAGKSSCNTCCVLTNVILNFVSCDRWKMLRKKMFWSSFPLVAGKSLCNTCCVLFHVINRKCFVRTCFGQALPWPLAKVRVVLFRVSSHVINGKCFVRTCFGRAFPRPLEQVCAVLFLSFVSCDRWKMLRKNMFW